jgi:hypothetical protein
MGCRRHLLQYEFPDNLAQHESPTHSIILRAAKQINEIKGALKNQRQVCHTLGYHSNLLLALDGAGSFRKMKHRLLAALFILLLCLSSNEVDAWRGHGSKRSRHTKAAAAAAKKLARQLGKVQGHRGPSHQAAKATAATAKSSMSYSAAVGYCTHKLKAAGDKGEGGWAAGQCGPWPHT